MVYPKIALEDGLLGLFSWFVVAVTCTIWSSHAGLYESPVMSVIEGTGSHPFVVPAQPGWELLVTDHRICNYALSLHPDVYVGKGAFSLCRYASLRECAGCP
jgi:hypothetical protein